MIRLMLIGYGVSPRSMSAHRPHVGSALMFLASLSAISLKRITGSRSVVVDRHAAALALALPDADIGVGSAGWEAGIGGGQSSSVQAARP